VETSPGFALEAQRLHVSGYLIAPADTAALEAELALCLPRLAAQDAESTTMRMRGGIKRVPFSQLVYAQTSNHDQVLHMLDGQTMQLRCSSQDLFDHLSHDTRFLKLGSSYIVNLDLVRSLNSNGAVLSFVEGSSASVPVRSRKTIQDALFTRAEWKKHA
jgi:DNA-binding LytR/AlgR family response regulator